MNFWFNSFKNNIHIYIQFFAWIILAYTLFFQYLLICDCNPTMLFWIKQCILMSSLITLYYVHAQVFIPKWIIEKKYPLYVFLTVTTVVVHILFSRMADRLILRPAKGVFQDIDFTTFEAVMMQINPFVGKGYYDKIIPILDLLLIAIGIILTISKKWQNEQKRRQELEQERLSSELTYLKAQINPHFFFNTLNNIYSYTLVDGDIARKAISNLSKMMRYVLYDSQTHTTTLIKEIEFIKDYIDLMKLRVTDKVKIETSFNFTNKDIPIAPMLFLPFVENAFKHGISTIEDCFIEIKLIQNGNNLTLEVINSLLSKRQSLDESNGIGLVNTKRRLDLLYAGKYELIAEPTENGTFEVKLKIDTQ
ncbi:sensor histidine kinase [Moheibacter sediminis]|nr:histidine kinase [Moheibacter sediminis]